MYIGFYKYNNKCNVQRNENHKYTVGTMSKFNRKMVKTDAKWITQS
jgi:hypothetical protein